MPHMLKQDHDQGYETFCLPAAGHVDVTEDPAKCDCEPCLRKLVKLGFAAIERLCELRKVA